MELTVSVPQPGKLISINEIAGRDWRSYSRTKNVWMDAGYYHGVELRSTLRKMRCATPVDRPVALQFEFDVHGKRERDGHNYASTVVKWFVDGMVIAKVLVDDSTEHLSVDDTTFTVVPFKEPLQMRVRLVDR